MSIIETKISFEQYKSQFGEDAANSAIQENGGAEPKEVSIYTAYSDFDADTNKAVTKNELSDVSVFQFAENNKVTTSLLKEKNSIFAKMQSGLESIVSSVNTAIKNIYDTLVSGFVGVGYQTRISASESEASSDDGRIKESIQQKLVDINLSYNKKAGDQILQLIQKAESDADLKVKIDKIKPPSNTASTEKEQTIAEKINTATAETDGIFLVDPFADTEENSTESPTRENFTLSLDEKKTAGSAIRSWGGKSKAGNKFAQEAISEDGKTISKDIKTAEDLVSIVLAKLGFEGSELASLLSNSSFMNDIINANPSIFEKSTGKVYSNAKLSRLDFPTKELIEANYEITEPEASNDEEAAPVIQSAPASVSTQASAGVVSVAGTDAVAAAPAASEEKFDITKLTTAMSIDDINKLDSDTDRIMAYNKFNYNGQYYGIVDKKSCQLKIYDKDGNVIKTFTVGVGKVKGDNGQQKRVTPAGEFLLGAVNEYDRNYTGSDGKYRLMDLYGDDSSTNDGQLAIHIVYQPEATKRSRAIETPQLNDNRMSYGCINLLQEDYDAMSEYLNGGCKLFILPEEKNNHLQLQQQSDGTYKFKQHKE